MARGYYGPWVLWPVGIMARGYYIILKMINNVYLKRQMLFYVLILYNVKL
jgi:hypothetical protein